MTSMNHMTARSLLPNKVNVIANGSVMISRLIHLKTLLIWVIFTSVLPVSVQGTESNAFNTLNLNPMVQIFGLPSLTNQIASSRGSLEFEIEQQAANYHSQSQLQNETLKLDGETWRTNFTITYGLTDQSTLSISTPYIRHSSGYMDDLIYNWHDTFGMPQGERTKDTNNNIDLQYSVGGRQQVDIKSPVSGMGDIRVKYVHRLPAFGRAILLQSEVKLPTGDTTTLTGSGGTDLSIGLMFNDALSLERQNINFWAGAAATYLGEADSLLSEEQNDLVWSARTGLGWRLTDSLALKTQLDTHSAAYNSDTTELGNAPVMLTIGGDYYFSPKYRLELSAVEDLVTEVSPDIVVSAKFSAKLE